MAVILVAPAVIGLKAINKSSDITRPVWGSGNSKDHDFHNHLTFPATPVFLRDAKVMDDAEKLTKAGKTPCLSKDQVLEIRDTYSRIVYTFTNHQFSNATTPAEQKSWQLSINKEIAAANGRLETLKKLEGNSATVLADTTGKLRCSYIDTVDPTRKMVKDTDR